MFIYLSENYQFIYIAQFNEFITNIIIAYNDYKKHSKN